jgi:release factor glutamine methyltransferase
MSTVAETLRTGTARLAAAGVDGAARDARLLMAEALGLAPGRLVLALPDAIAAGPAQAFDAMVTERTRRRPVSQILGRRSFWGRDFEVTADVLDPRPETETLIAAALGGPPPASILDLGTGSGAILLTLLAEWPGATGFGIDTSTATLAVAERNAARFGLAARAVFRRGDWLENLEGRYDLIVCNPPYIAFDALHELSADVREWEPHAALTPGPTGLESYHAIAPRLAGHLASGGRALFEIGAGQAEVASAVFAAAGFGHIEVHRDFDGRERVIALRTGI